MTKVCGQLTTRAADAESPSLDGSGPPGPFPGRSQSDREARAVGSAIGRRRRARGLTLGDLTAACGLSPSFLSLVERGKSTLSLTSLFSVARALDVGVSDLLPEAPVSAPAPTPGKWEITRAGSLPSRTLTSGSRVYSFLGAHFSGRVLEPLLVTVQASPQGEGPVAHEGEEFAWVLDGELCYIIEDTEYVLRPGDSIHLTSSVRHTVKSAKARPAKVLWIMSQPLLDERIEPHIWGGGEVGITR